MLSGISPNTKVKCLGGPYDGCELNTSSAKFRTLKFTARGMTGYYEYFQCKSYPTKEPRYKWIGTPNPRLTDPSLNYIFCR